MSTEHTIVDGDDWFINRDLYEDDEIILYTKDTEIAMTDGTHAVTISREQLEALKGIEL